jgi:hypothetical protein
MMPNNGNLIDLVKRLSNKAIMAIEAKAPDRENQRERVEICLGV